MNKKIIVFACVVVSVLVLLACSIQKTGKGGDQGPSPSPVYVAQCRDSIDNDNDGAADYQSDAGCTGPDDDNEGDIRTQIAVEVVKRSYDPSDGVGIGPVEGATVQINIPIENWPTPTISSTQTTDAEGIATFSLSDFRHIDSFPKEFRLPGDFTPEGHNLNADPYEIFVNKRMEGYYLIPSQENSYSYSEAVGQTVTITLDKISTEPVEHSYWVYFDYPEWETIDIEDVVTLPNSDSCDITSTDKEEECNDELPIADDGISVITPLCIGADSMYITECCKDEYGNELPGCKPCIFKFQLKERDYYTGGLKDLNAIAGILYRIKTIDGTYHYGTASTNENGFVIINPSVPHDEVAQKDSITLWASTAVYCINSEVSPGPVPCMQDGKVCHAGFSLEGLSGCSNKETFDIVMDCGGCDTQEFAKKCSKICYRGEIDEDCGENWWEKFSSGAVPLYCIEGSQCEGMSEDCPGYHHRRIFCESCKHNQYCVGITSDSS